MVYKDQIEIQIEHSKNRYDVEELSKKEWIVIGKKEANKYRMAIVEKLVKFGIAKVIAFGFQINKLWLILNWFLMQYKDKVRIKQIQIDVAVSDQGKPYSVLKVIIERRDQNV